MKITHIGFLATEDRSLRFFSRGEALLSTQQTPPPITTLPSGLRIATCDGCGHFEVPKRGSAAMIGAALVSERGFARFFVNRGADIGAELFLCRDCGDAALTGVSTSFYGRIIRDLTGCTAREARIVEQWMRDLYRTLDHLDRSRFNREARAAYRDLVIYQNDHKRSQDHEIEHDDGYCRVCIQREQAAKGGVL